MGPFQIEIIKNNHLNSFVYVRERDGSERSRNFLRVGRKDPLKSTTPHLTQVNLFSQNKIQINYIQNIHKVYF